MLIYIPAKLSVSVHFRLGLILWFADGNKAFVVVVVVFYCYALLGLNSIIKSSHGLRWLLAATSGHMINLDKSTSTNQPLQPCKGEEIDFSSGSRLNPSPLP